AADARRAAEHVRDAIHRLAPAFRVALPDPGAALAAALSNRQDGLVAITDPGDNPLSGGACDTPGLFRALVDARVGVPALFASFAAPGVVATARQAGRGATIDVVLGGRLAPHFGSGVPVRAAIERLTDGIFRNVGPMQTGVERSCGNTVVLAIADQPWLRV